MNNDQVIEKIQKLLNLSKNNDSPEEAASAASLATTLMEKHNIEMADVESGDGADAEIVDEAFGVPGSHRDGRLKSKSGWQGELATVIAPAFGCAVIWRTTRDLDGTKRCTLTIAGRKNDVAAAIMAKEFCHREIDTLTAKHAGGRGRSYGVSFRVGAVHTIREQINAERAALRTEMQGTVSSSALVVVDTRAEAAKESFGRTRKSRSSRKHNAEAFFKGQAAGQSVWNGTKSRIA